MGALTAEALHRVPAKAAPNQPPAGLATQLAISMTSGRGRSSHGSQADASPVGRQLLDQLRALGFLATIKFPAPSMPSASSTITLTIHVMHLGDLNQRARCVQLKNQPTHLRRHVQ